VKSDEDAYKVVHPGDFVYNPMNVRFGAVARYTGDKKISVSKYYDVFSASSSVNTKFLAEYLKTHKTLGFYNRVATGALDEKKRVHFSDFVGFERLFPTKAEQQKIAEFLSSVDKKMSLLKEKHALLKHYKKGVMQKLFKQEIRFKDDTGCDYPDWQEQRFEQVFERVTRKNKEDNQNVLTISAQRGLINQEKYFNKSVSAKDVTGYYLLEKGDFAYNKSYSKGYPMGAIKRLNNYDKGVVSTLYICFKSHGEQHDEFWEQYFEAGNLNREINKIAQEGARNHGLLNVSVTEFFHDVKVVAPCAEEQQKIADFLQALDIKLDAVNQQIELTQTFKKGLLQQMFV
jgi:type I restriction enzyme S subunit